MNFNVFELNVLRLHLDYVQEIRHFLIRNHNGLILNAFLDYHKQLLGNLHCFDLCFRNSLNHLITLLDNEISLIL